MMVRGRSEKTYSLKISEKSCTKVWEKRVGKGGGGVRSCLSEGVDSEEGTEPKVCIREFHYVRVIKEGGL